MPKSLLRNASASGMAERFAWLHPFAMQSNLCRKVFLGTTHLDVAEAFMALADLYDLTKQEDKAQEYSIEALKIKYGLAAQGVFHGTLQWFCFDRKLYSTTENTF